MVSRWNEACETWLKESPIPLETAKWAIQSIRKNESTISKLEEDLSSQNSKETEIEKIENILKELKRSIKKEVISKENELDGIALNAPNSCKLQISVPSNLNYAMKAWAAAEGRDLSSVAMLCMETGFRKLKSKGSIPSAALKRYESACEKRIALAEANHLWDKYEQTTLKKLFS